MSMFTRRMTRGQGGSGGAVVQPLRFASPTNIYPQGTQITSAGTKLVCRTRSPAVLGSGDATSFMIGKMRSTTASRFTSTSTDIDRAS